MYPAIAVRPRLAGPDPIGRRDTPEVPRDEGTLVSLFCAWLFFQCFQYQALPYLRWNLGIILTPDRVLLFAMLATFAKRGFFRRSPANMTTVAATTLGRLWVLFALIGTTSWLVSGSDASSTKFAELTHLYCLAFLPALSYFLARRLQYTRAMLTQMLRFFAIVGVYLSVTAVCERYGVTALIYPKYILDPTVGIQFGRSRGPFVDTIADGGMLLVSFLSISCVASSFTGVKRFIALLLAFLVVPAVYFTDTRSVWLGLGASIVTLSALRTPLRRTGGLIGAVILLSFLVGASSKFSLYGDTLFSRRQNTVDARYDNYQLVWNAFKAHPLFGLGYGNLKKEWSKYFSRDNSRLGVGLDDGNHSTILGILGELGITGGVPYLTLLMCSMVVCVGAYRALRDPECKFERQFAVVALGALEVYLVLSITNDLKAMPTVNVSAFWLVGVATSLHSARLATKAAQVAERGTSRLAPRRPSHPVSYGPRRSL
jgi:O-antigen ligase